MTKYSLDKCHWKAIHKNKTVQKPNYVDIDRATIESFELYSEDKKLLFTLDCSKNKKLFVRLSTYMNASGVKSRFWKIGTTNPFKLYIIDEEGKVTEQKKVNGSTFTRFRPDEV